MREQMPIPMRMPIPRRLNVQASGNLPWLCTFRSYTAWLPLCLASAPTDGSSFFGHIYKSEIKKGANSFRSLFGLSAVVLCARFVAVRNLAEVLDTTFKNRLEVIARDVLEIARSPAFSMSHFAKDAAVRAGNAFDCHNRAIGIHV